MEKNINKSMKIAILSLFSIFISCATTPEVKKETEQIIDAGSYSVSVPPTKRGKMFGTWKISVEREKGIVAFQLARRNPLSGDVVDTTLILVAQNKVKPELWHLSEEDVANDYRKSEEKIMTEEGVMKGLYTLKDIKLDTMTLDDKKLYTMSYTKLIGRTLGGFTEKATLFLYFPSDFSKNHNFYIFLLSFMHGRGALRTFYPTEEVYHVIKSFQQK